MSARPLRRFVAVSACLASLQLFPQAASPAGVGGQARGEVGSGPPSWTAPRTLAPTDNPDVKWSDVNRKHWARTAIDHVAASNDWMRDAKPATDGTTAFEPDARESRKLFARALYRAFGSGLGQDADLRFD